MTLPELKDKLKLEDAFEQKLSKVTTDSSTSASDVNAKNEAIQALVALGYSNTEALKAVRGIEITPDMDTEEILKLSLKKISFL